MIHRSFRGALVAYVVLPLVVALTVLVTLGLRGLEAESRKRMQDDVKLVARAIELPLAGALSKEREGTIEEILDSVSTINRVYGIYVYDNDGRLIASNGETSALPDRGDLVKLAEAGDTSDEYGRVAGRRVYSFFTPLTALDSRGGLTEGLLQVTRRGRDFDESLQSLRVQAALLVLLGALLMTGVTLSGHFAAIGRHIRQLVESMARVEGGQRHHRASTEGPREVVQLSTSLNRMLDSISAAEQEIEVRRQRELELHDQLQQREKLASIGRLSAGVAHELGTPLSVIDGQAQRALRSQDLPPAQVAVMESIRKEVGRLTSIVRQLLDFGRHSAREARQVDVGDIVQSTLTNLQDEAAQREVGIHVHNPEVPIQMKVDPIRLEQMLSNLVRNAMQATPRGEVHVYWEYGEGQALFRIVDDGPGIDDAVKPRLFEPFFTTKPVGEGTGLGLAVVHGVVKEYGGTIDFVNRPEGGTEVRVALQVNNLSDEGEPV